MNNMKRILPLILSIIVGLALMAPVAAFAQQPTPTPKGKGSGQPAGKQQFNQQAVHPTTTGPVHTPPPKSFVQHTPPPQPFVQHTPPPQPFVQHTPPPKPFVRNTGQPTPPPTGTGKPLYHKTLNNNPNTTGNQTNQTNQTNTTQTFKKGAGLHKPSPSNPTGNTVVNNSNVVKTIPKLKQSNSWAGPKWKGGGGGGGGGGQPFTQANNYGGHWVAGNAHSDWNRHEEHDWDGHHFRWFNGGWLIIDNGFWPQGYYPYYQYGASKIATAQAELANMGYYNGDIDGVPGPMTRQAIADYQADNGLPVDGRLNPPTQDSLGL